MLHTSLSVKVWQRAQWRMRATASSRATAIRRAPSRSCWSRCHAIRCANLTPTPGRRRSASISPSSAGSAANLERQLHPRRQRHAGGELAHLLLTHLLGLADAVVERGGDEILEHVLVLAEQARVDRDALDVVLARHRHLDEAGARLAFDLDRRQLVLGLLEVVLHRLRLLHQAGQLTLHHGWCSSGITTV